MFNLSIKSSDALSLCRHPNLKQQQKNQLGSKMALDAGVIIYQSQCKTSDLR